MNNEDLVLGLFAALPAAVAWLLVVLMRRTPAWMNSRPWLKLLAGNFLVFLGLASLVLLVGELYFRFAVDTTESFGINKVTARWFERHYQLNSTGARDDVPGYSRDRTRGMPRVTFFGDSFTAGHGVADVHDCFPLRIRSQHPDWEIHSLAQVGMDTCHELDALEKAVDEKYQLDTVVLVFCLNDISYTLPDWTEFIAHYDSLRSHNYVLTNSYFLDTLHGRWVASHNPRMKEYFPFISDAYAGPGWDKQKQDLIAFQQCVESHGGHLLVVTFPFLHDLGPNYRYTSVHRQLDAFWRERHVPHLDLLDTFAGCKPADVVVNPHDAHPNVQAHAMAAKAIQSFLEKEMPPPVQRP